MQEEIPIVHAGDEAIKADVLNGVINSVNTLNKFDFALDSFDSISYTANGKRVVGSTQVIKDYPFELSRLSSEILKIKRGQWIRNQVGVTLQSNAASGSTDVENKDDFLQINIADFSNAGASDPLVADIPYYVYVQLAANVAATTFTIDEAILPGALELHVDQSKLYAGIKGPSWLFDDLRFEDENEAYRSVSIKTRSPIGHVILNNVGADFYISDIVQYIDEDIIDSQIVLDTESKNGLTRFRSTLEHRLNAAVEETDGTHFGEIQINNVGMCAGVNTYSIPYFQSFSTANDLIGPDGTIYWAAIDSLYYPKGEDGVALYNPSIKTLDVIVDDYEDNRPNEYADWDEEYNSFKYFTLRNVDTCRIFSKSIPHFDSDDYNEQLTAKGELQWHAVDSHCSELEQYSLEFASNVDGVKYFQIFEFDLGGEFEDLVDADRAIMRDADGGGNGPMVRYVDKEAFNNWLDYGNSASFCDSVFNCFGGDICGYIQQNCDLSWVSHTNLDFSFSSSGEAEQNEDHDWRYTVVGDTWQGWKSAGAGVWFQSIGRGNKDGSIGGYAQDADALAINLMDMRLHSCTSSYTLDWTVCSLRYGDKVCLDWANKALEDDAAECLTWDSTSVDITSTPVLKVLNTSAATDIDEGALQVQGGFSAKKQSYLTDGTYTSVLLYSEDIPGAGFFSNGTDDVFLAHEDGYGVYVTSGTGINVNNASNTAAYFVKGTKVLGNQQAAEADIADTTGVDSDGTCRAKVNNILAKLRTHGIIAT